MSNGPRSGAIVDYLNSAARFVGAEVSSPWLYFRLGLVITAAGAALAVNGLIRSRIDVAARGKDWRPALQRFVRELQGSAFLAVFAVLMALARTSMAALTGPHGSYLLSVASNLAFAWLIIRLASSGIRNAFVVRVVSLVAFLVAALSIMGRLEPVLATPDSVSVTLGGLRLSPLILIELGLLLIVALLLADIVSNFIESRITRSSELTPSGQVLLVKIIRLALMIFAVAADADAGGAGEERERRQVDAGRAQRCPACRRSSPIS